MICFSVTQFPTMDTIDEELLPRGTFISYDNYVYLGGACNVGKSTLASILIGEEISQHWKSTNGLTTYFGRNGIDLKNKEMVPLKQGNTSKHLINILQNEQKSLKIFHSLIKDLSSFLFYSTVCTVFVPDLHVIPLFDWLPYIIWVAK